MEAYLRKLRRNQAEYKELGLRQVLERLERPRTGRVVLKVVPVNVDLLEQLDSNAVVAALAEVHSVLEVPAAEMQTYDHIGRPALQTVVVHLDVQLEHRVRVQPGFLHALNHRLGAEVREQRVIELDVPATRSVERLDLFPVGYGNIREVLL